MRTTVQPNIKKEEISKLGVNVCINLVDGLLFHGSNLLIWRMILAHCTNGIEIFTSQKSRG